MDKEGFDAAFPKVSRNLDLIMKLLFYTPWQLSPSAKKLVLSLIDLPKFRKHGIFASYCSSLMV